MRISVNKTVGSSSIHVTIRKDEEEKLEDVAKIAQHLFELLPEPSFTAGENGVSVFAGLPLPMFKPGDEAA
jgi:hypothetical protein